MRGVRVSAQNGQPGGEWSWVIPTPWSSLREQGGSHLSFTWSESGFKNELWILPLILPPFLYSQTFSITLFNFQHGGLKLNIQKTKIMASGPITSWQTDGETMETVTDFIFLSSKITEDGDCSHEIKRHLLLGRKSMTNLDSILKSRDITLPTNVHIVQAMVFLVLMYGYKSWITRKVECQRIDAFEL